MLTPPEMIVWSERPVMNRYPSPSRWPRSPIRAQPRSLNIEADFSGSLWYENLLAGRVNQMMPSWPGGSSRPDSSVIATEAGATRPAEPDGAFLSGLRFAPRLVVERLRAGPPPADRARILKPYF